MKQKLNKSQKSNKSEKPSRIICIIKKFEYLQS